MPNNKVLAFVTHASGRAQAPRLQKRVHQHSHGRKHAKELEVLPEDYYGRDPLSLCVDEGVNTDQYFLVADEQSAKDDSVLAVHPNKTSPQGFGVLRSNPDYAHFVFEGLDLSEGGAMLLDDFEAFLAKEDLGVFQGFPQGVAPWECCELGSESEATF